MPEWSSDFSYFFQFKPEFCNQELMIGATVNSRPCFCWKYRTSPSSTAKNTISLIFISPICWCPCVESSPGLLEKDVCYDDHVLLTELNTNCVSLCPASFCTLRPRLACYSEYLLTSYFCIPIPYDGKYIFWNKPRSFCHFWNCTQVLHFRFFCWLWGLLHFF